MGVTVTFIAILELVREGLIDVVQTAPYAPLHVRAADGRRGLRVVGDDADATPEAASGVEALTEEAAEADEEVFEEEPFTAQDDSDEWPDEVDEDPPAEPSDSDIEPSQEPDETSS